MATCLKSGFCVTPRKESELRTVAEKVRGILSDHADIKFFDIIKVLEHKMPEVCPAFRYEIVEPLELPDREAEMNPLELCIRIREDVYLKAMDGDGHCRFTVAHELGHFFLHRTQTLAFGRKAENGKIPTFQNSEWQADVFARNLLAPFSMTQGMVSNQIALVFGVSKEVAKIIAGTPSQSVPTGAIQLTLNI